MASEKISLSIPKEILSQIDAHVENNNITRSAFFKDLSKEWLKKRLEEDARELSKITYDDLPTEEEWLIIQNECDKYGY